MFAISKCFRTVTEYYLTFSIYLIIIRNSDDDQIDRKRLTVLVFNKGLVSSTHLLQGIFSTWNKEKLCSPGATKKKYISIPYVPVKISQRKIGSHDP